MKITQYLLYKLGRKSPSERVIDKIRSGGGKVGSNVQILNSSIDLRIPYLISIGNNVTITGATLLTHDATTKMELGYTKFGSINIGNNVFVGIGSIILPCTSIGDKVIIGSGCVVGKDIPSNSVVIGNPCRIICTYDDYIEKYRKEIDAGKVKVFDMSPYQIVESNANEQVPEGKMFFAL